MEKNICDICSKLCSTKGNLKEHFETVHEKKTNFTCKICGTSCYRFREIKAHMQKKHPGEEGQIEAIVRYGQRNQENPYIQLKLTF